MIPYPSCRFNRILIEITAIYCIQKHTWFAAILYRITMNNNVSKTTGGSQVTIRCLQHYRNSSRLITFQILAEHTCLDIFTAYFQISRQSCFHPIKFRSDNNRTGTSICNFIILYLAIRRFYQYAPSRNMSYLVIDNSESRPDSIR